MKKIEKINHGLNNKTSRAYVIAGSICVIIILIVLLVSIKNHSEKNIVNNGTVEKTETVVGYLVKNEKVIDKDSTKVIVPVISEGSKAAKKSIIATYKGKEYEDYEEKLASMDKEILDLMQDLPTVYSSEVETIEKEIYQNLKASIGETSYIKMQDYEKKIDSKMNSRAIIIGNLSPKGAEVKKLIEKRNAYEQSAKKSNDNMISPMTGIVSYKTDGCEEKLNTKNINDLTFDDIKSLVSNNLGSNNSTSIKVVNNYSAYIVTKVDLDNLAYIKEGKKYNIKLIENSNTIFKGTITKFEVKDNGVEVYFEITNGIEELVDLRDIDIEITWWTDTGLYVANNALNKFEKIDAYYVRVLKSGEYVNVPIKIRSQSDKYSIIENYTNAEMKELKIDRKYTLKQYDKIVIESNK